MSHDELVAAVGEAAYRTITEAGFVLVPKTWRDRRVDELAQSLVAVVKKESAK